MYQKKNVLIASLALSMLMTTGARLFAQDLLVKKDGTILKGRVAEITEESVKYKKFENPDGPLYSIEKENIAAINYENGQVEKFGDTETTNSEESETSESKSILEDENLKRSIEAIAKDAGEQLLQSCAKGRPDNSTTEIYWDGVFRDEISGTLTIPIVIKWKPKWTDGNGKWVRGKVTVDKGGIKTWYYQNDSGMMFSACAKTFRLR